MGRALLLLRSPCCSSACAAGRSGPCCWVRRGSSRVSPEAVGGAPPVESPPPDARRDRAGRCHGAAVGPAPAEGVPGVQWLVVVDRSPSMYLELSAEGGGSRLALRCALRGLPRRRAFRPPPFATSTGRLRARESGSRTGWGRLPPQRCSSGQRPLFPSRAGERSIVPASSGSRTACRRSRPPPLGGWRAGAKPYPAPWAGGPTARCSGTALEPSPGSTPRSGRAPGSGGSSTPSSLRSSAPGQPSAASRSSRSAGKPRISSSKGRARSRAGARTGAAGAMDGGCRTRWTPERRPGAGVPGGSRQAMDRAMTSSPLPPDAWSSRLCVWAPAPPADAFAVSMGALLDGAFPAVGRAARRTGGRGRRGEVPPAACHGRRAARDGARGTRAWPAPGHRSVGAHRGRLRGGRSHRAGARAAPDAPDGLRSSAARTASIAWSTPLRRNTSGPPMRATPSRSSEPSSLTAIPFPRVSGGGHRPRAWRRAARADCVGLEQRGERGSVLRQLQVVDHAGRKRGEGAPLGGEQRERLRPRGSERARRRRGGSRACPDPGP